MLELAPSVSLVVAPSYDAACSLVPPEYVRAWDWFLREEQRGARWRNLPHRARDDDPQFAYRPQEFPLTRDSGIFSIGLAHLSAAPQVDFALSVHNSKRGAYADVPPLHLDDGTWVLKYAAHVRGEGDGHFQDYNPKLFNCMKYGVPVGVFFTEGTSYRVMGLAFVERYEPENGWFILHGPVHKGGADPRFCPDWSFDTSGPADLEYSSASPSDDERVQYALHRQRVGQQRFRKELFDAYDGCCAVSDCAVDTVLEAAHIESYSGQRSQAVNNGILLRCDLHALFDAHLITFSFERGTYRMRESYLLGKSDYAGLDGAPLRAPRDERLRPSERFLTAHEVEFSRQEIRRREGNLLPYGVV